MAGQVRRLSSLEVSVATALITFYRVNGGLDMILLCSEMGYRAYGAHQSLESLYRPFVSVYFGAAYVKWLSTYEGKYVCMYIMSLHLLPGTMGRGVLNRQ